VSRETRPVRTSASKSFLLETVIESKAGQDFEMIYLLEGTDKFFWYELVVDGNFADSFNYNCARSAMDEAIEHSVEGFEGRTEEGVATIQRFTFGRVETTGGCMLENFVKLRHYYLGFR
jgi:hypothetical protein